MKRNPAKMSGAVYDLLVIGGGITGACAAWDATLRGLSVALVDKADFGGATSAASGKRPSANLENINSSSTKTSKLCSSPDSNTTSISSSLLISSANLAAVDAYAQEVQCLIVTRTIFGLSATSSSYAAPENKTGVDPADSIHSSRAIFLSIKTSCLMICQTPRCNSTISSALLQIPYSVSSAQ